LGKNLLILPECPSTNTQAAELSQAGKAPEGTVVITHHQTAGRGQRGNTWESGKGLNLTFSLVLHPVFLTAGQQFQLNKAIALAIHDVVKNYTEESVRVKWPNDVMINNKKVCGILIENQLTGDRLSRSIVGIGLNVNQNEFDSPTATSVSVHSGKPIELGKLFEELLQSLEWRYLELKKGNGLNHDYLDALFRFNEPHKYILSETEVEGIIRGVDDYGRLVLEIENNLRALDLKQIKFVY